MDLRKDNLGRASNTPLGVCTEGNRAYINTTTRHKAKTLANLEVAFQACTQAFETQAFGKRLENGLFAAPRFPSDF